MGSIIVALPKIEEAQKISGLLRRQGIIVDVLCKEGHEILERTHELDNGIVVVSSKFSDMSAVQLYEYLPDFFDMVVIAGNREYEFPAGVVRLSNPFKVSELAEVIETLDAQQTRRLKKKKAVPKSRSEGEKALIDKAKLLLMNSHDMTEPEAYRFMQKSSMDKRMDIVDFARCVIG